MNRMRWSIVTPWLITVGLCFALVATGRAAAATQAGNRVAIVAGLMLIGLWGVANATVRALIAWRRGRPGATQTRAPHGRRPKSRPTSMGIWLRASGRMVER